MKLLSILAFTGLVAASTNTSQEYQLQTQLKPGQTNKKQFGGLWLSSYHTGAGLNDVVFSTARSGASKGYLGKTNVTGPGGKKYYNQEFDLGTEFPWGLVMAENTNFYAAWEPVRMNAGASGSEYDVSGFFINKTGLQWNSATGSADGSSNGFGGWLVCDWWHGVPQLFFRLSYYDTKAPSSCADVNLLPRYI